MGDNSDIEWCDATWNPTTGCDQVSPGCDHCYALTMAKRLKAMGSPAYQRDGDPRTSGPGFALQVHEGRLDQPLRWTRPRRIFVNSMSDLFHPKVPDEFIARAFAVMALAQQHTFQVLTKRPKRMRTLLSRHHFWALVGLACLDDHDLRWPPEEGVSLDAHALPNVWLGTSVEDQQRAGERIPSLLDTPAAVRFLSCEPLLGPVDLPAATPDDGAGLDWVIVGGESGPDARPMHPRWVRDLRDQCRDATVPFFFKQWGEWVEPSQVSDVAADVLVRAVGLRDGTVSSEAGGPDDATVWRVGKRDAGRQLDGRTHDEFPDATNHKGTNA